MSKFTEIVDKLPQTPETMEHLTEICDHAFTALYKADKQGYAEVMEELEGLAYHISKSKAENIVNSMKPYGEKWSYDKIKEFISTKGITEHITKYYLSMNMAYNDYRKTAEMVGKADDAEFYFSLAHDFITDVDGEPYKVEKYFMGDNE